MTEQDRTRPKGRPRDAAMDDAIMAAALKVFVERGLEGTTIERIAREAGTTRPAIYRRWTNKTELLIHAIGRLREQISDAAGAWQGMRLETFVAWIIDHAPAVLTNPRHAALVARFVGATPDAPQLLAEVWRQYIQPRRAEISAMIEEARGRGALRSDAQADTLVDMVSGAVVIRLMFHDTRPDEQEWRAYLIELFKQMGFPVPD